MANKVKYGLKNVYYAPVTAEDANTGELTYGEPVRWPGAVTLTMDPSGEQEPFYADDIVYFVAGGSEGYAGSLESALVPESFAVDILGEEKDSKNVMVETSSPVMKKFALLFEFSADEKAIRHVFYNCAASRGSVSGNTKGASKTPITESVNITASETYCSAVDKMILKGRTASDTDTTTYNGWYSEVHTPTRTAG